MIDTQMHPDRLRDDAAECAMRAAETVDKQNRDRFLVVCRYLSWLADQLEHATTSGHNRAP
jgi:hypothetical protein